MQGVTDIDYKPRRRWHEDPRPPVYVAMEVKTDGGDVGRNAMRSLAAVAVQEGGQAVGTFQINLAAPEGTVSDPRMVQLYRDHGDAWQVMTIGAQRPAVAIPAFIQWVTGLPGQPVVVGTPLVSLGLWMETYLRRYSSHVFYRGPFDGEMLFAGGGIDLPTFVMGVSGRSYKQAIEHMLPADWRGGRVETHKAKEDAEMHAALFATMLRMRAQRGA